MAVTPSQLDELKAVSNLSEWEKGEARSCIKLLLFLRRRQSTDMDLVEVLSQLLEGIPTMTNLYNIVQQFKRNNPHLEDEQASNNISNGTLIFTSFPLNQKEAFRKMLLIISENLTWPHLEIMVALSPTPEGNKERLTRGIHLFEEMKLHGCISENDTELLQSLFTLLNLKAPMDILQQYLSEFLSVTTNQYEPSAPPSLEPFHSPPSNYEGSYSGPPAMSSESHSMPVSASYSLPFPNPSFQPSYGSDQMYSRYRVPQPSGRLDDFRHPLPHRPGSGSPPESSEPPAHAQHNPPPGPQPFPSLSIPEQEERPEKQLPKMRNPGETTVEGGSPNSALQPFVGRSNSGASSLSSLRSTITRRSPVNVASQDEGVTTYPPLNCTPHHIPMSSSHQPSTRPPATPVSQTLHVSKSTAGTHTHSAPMPGTSKLRTPTSGVPKPGSSKSSAPKRSNPTSTASTRVSGKKESSSTEMLPPQKRPRTSESVSVSIHQSISQAAILQGNIRQGHPIGEYSAPSSIDANTGYSTTSSTYSAGGVETQFLTPHSEQGQLQPTPGQSLSEQSSIASFSGHPCFPIPLEEQNGVPMGLSRQNPTHLPAPPVNSSPPRQYIVAPRIIRSSPNVMPTMRANQLSTATSSMRAASTTARSVPYMSRPRQPATPQMTENGNIVASPVSGNQNVDLQNPTGELSHGAEAYSSMSSYGQPSLASTESSLASYQAGSLNLPPPVERHHTGEIPTFVPGTNATQAAGSEQRSTNIPAARIRGGASRLYPYDQPSLASTESSLASYQAGSLNLPPPVERHHTGEIPTFVPGTNATQAAGSEQRSTNIPAARIRGGASRLYPLLTSEETIPAGNDEPLSEGSSFTTVSSNLAEESSPSTEMSTRKRPRTRSQKGSKEDDQSSTSKRQKTTTATNAPRKTKVSSKNIKSTNLPEKVKIKLEKTSLSSKFLSYLWPFGSKGTATAEAEESEQQQSGEDDPETEEAQTSDGEYESAKEEEPNRN